MGFHSLDFTHVKGADESVRNTLVGIRWRCQGKGEPDMERRRIGPAKRGLAM